MSNVDKLIYDLAAIGAIRLGAMTANTNPANMPPVHLDLRPLVAHPHVMRRAAHALAEVIEGLQFDRLAGMNGAILPLSTAIALELTRPLIYSCCKPEQGELHTIEGLYSRGETVLPISGVLGGGQALIDAIHSLEAVGLQVNEVAVLIDRAEGGPDSLKQDGYKAHSVMTMSELIDALRRRKASGPLPAIGGGR